MKYAFRKTENVVGFIGFGFGYWIFNFSVSVFLEMKSQFRFRFWQKHRLTGTSLNSRKIDVLQEFTGFSTTTRSGRPTVTTCVTWSSTTASSVRPTSTWPKTGSWWSWTTLSTTWPFSSCTTKSRDQFLLFVKFWFNSDVSLPLFFHNDDNTVRWSHFLLSWKIARVWSLALASACTLQRSWIETICLICFVCFYWHCHICLLRACVCL